MKKIFSALMLVTIHTVILMAGENLKDWPYYRELAITGGNRYCHLFLDEYVYGYSNDDLSDLRIIDSKKKFVPYYIVRGAEVQKNEETVFKTRRIFDYSLKKEMLNYFDFQVLPPDKKIYAAKLILEADSDNFSKRVGVYARNESGDWVFLKDDTIYDFAKNNGTNNRYKKTGIALNSGVPYAFYRIVIIDNPEKISIKDMKVVYAREETNFENYKKNIKMNYIVENKDRYSLVIADNVNKLEIMKLYFTVKGTFKRNAELFDDAQLTGSIHSAELYQFDFNNTNVSSTSINFESPVHSKKLYIKIINNDDRPLEIIKISADYITDKLVFEYKEDESYSLLFGNEKSEKPVYDISAYSAYIEKEKQDEAGLGSMKVNGSHARKQHFNYRLLFNIIIILVSVLLISVTGMALFRISKKQN